MAKPPRTRAKRASAKEERQQKSLPDATVKERVRNCRAKRKLSDYLGWLSPLMDRAPNGPNSTFPPLTKDALEAFAAHFAVSGSFFTAVLALTAQLSPIV